MFALRACSRTALHRCAEDRNSQKYTVELPHVSAIVDEPTVPILGTCQRSPFDPMRSRTVGLSPVFVVALCSLVVVISSLSQHL
jgi:hypothetical protein